MKKFFTIPNEIDDRDLSVFAFRLYCHIKRVAGDKGTCDQNIRALAESTGMSMGSLVRAREELVREKLISIERIKNERGGWSFVELRIGAGKPAKVTKRKRLPDPPKRKPKKTRDPLLDHEAVKIYRDVIRRHIPVTWRQEVCETVGDKHERWKETCYYWLGKGWNPGNIAGMLEAFKDEKRDPARMRAPVKEERFVEVHG